VVAEVASKYPQVKILFIEDLGGWNLIQKQFFADGVTFDKIQAASKA
jgi:sulfate/thiosulfate transport system substrate-binding protein